MKRPRRRDIRRSRQFLEDERRTLLELGEDPSRELTFEEVAESYIPPVRAAPPVDTKSPVVEPIVATKVRKTPTGGPRKLRKSDGSAARGAGVQASTPPVAAKSPRSRKRDPRVWKAGFELHDHVVRDIAERLKRGEHPRAIADAVGISLYLARKKCDEIAALIGLPSQAEIRATRRNEVCALADEGLTDAQIAERIGGNREAIAAMRRNAQGARRRQIALTDDERSEIDRRILRGERPREIARRIGCDLSTVKYRAQPLRNLVKVSPCACGQPGHHTGPCSLQVDIAHVRARVLAGATRGEIAREFGRSTRHFSVRYLQPILEQIAAEGHKCGCGQPLGHPVMCAITAASRRTVFTLDQRKTVERLAREGTSAGAVKAALSISGNAASHLLRETRAGLARLGVACPCGKPIDHPKSCEARNAPLRVPKPKFAFRTAAARALSEAVRTRISKLARAGFGRTAILAKTGASRGGVEAVLAELAAAERLPSHCVCGARYNHNSPCRQVRRAVHPQRRRSGRKKGAGASLPPGAVAEIKRTYQPGVSIADLSARAGISVGIARGLIAQWEREARYPRRLCGCGRPARHVGGCLVNTGSIGNIELARIRAGLIAGDTHETIAAKIGVDRSTVLKHARPMHGELAAQGVTCGCGRVLGHRYRCSARPAKVRNELSPSQRKVAMASLLRGDSPATATNAVGLARGVRACVDRLLRSLDCAQRAERDRAIQQRLKRRRLLHDAKLMARMESSVPRNLEPALRDDVIAELRLALVDGDVVPSEIEAAAERYARRAIARWQSKFGPRSLDEKMTGDSDLTLSGIIGDATVALMIDEIEIGKDSE